MGTDKQQRVDPWLVSRGADPQPWEGYTGFRGAHAKTPPYQWERAHVLAEGGGYARVERRWRPLSERGPLAMVKAMPTAQLYACMIDRISLDAAAEMGYTVDA